MSVEQNERHETASGDRQEPPAHQPMFNVPSSILLLIALFALVHLLRSLLTPEQDIAVLIYSAFIPARYLDGFIASGWLGITTTITYNFLHGDGTHLAINCIWMLAMGSAVAKRLGSLRFFLFSIICGMFAALAHLLTHFGEAVPVIGASGAISGHMAAAIRFIFSVERGDEGAHMIHHRLQDIPLKSLSQSLQDGRVLAILGIWLVTNVLTGIGGIPLGDEDVSIAWEAHIGGFVAGLLLFSLFDRPENGRGGRARDDDEEGAGIDQGDHDEPSGRSYKSPWEDETDKRSDQNNLSS